MSTFFFLPLICILIYEIFLIIFFKKKLLKNKINFKEFIIILRSTKINDKNKEEYLLTFSKNLIVYSLKIFIALLIVILLFILIVPESLIRFIFSTNGLLYSTIIISIYHILRKLVFK